MKSRGSESFWEAYYKLPPHIKIQARTAYQQFRDNPSHPSLRFKRVHASRPLYSARVSGSYRAVGILVADTITWDFIGDHAAYERYILNFR